MESLYLITGHIVVGAAGGAAVLLGYQRYARSHKKEQSMSDETAEKTRDAKTTEKSESEPEISHMDLLKVIASQPPSPPEKPRRRRY